MSVTTFATIGRWARRGAWVALLCALALPLGAYVADLGWGHKVRLIAPYDPSVVTLNRTLWSAGDPIVEIYGSPMSAPTRVLLLTDQNLVHPEEGPSLALLPLDAGGKRVVQVQTLWWAVRIAGVGLGAMTAALLGLSLFARRQERLALAARAL